MAAQIVKQSNVTTQNLSSFFRRPKLASQIILICDWLSGPPLSEQERIDRKLTDYNYRERLWTEAFLMGR
jgi:hypothetical protein